MYDYNRQSDEMLCPYCGFDFADSQEIIDRDKSDKTKVECPECKKKFWGYAHISVVYCTKRDCEINGEEHEFERIKQLQMTQCKNCGELKSL